MRCVSGAQRWSCPAISSTTLSLNSWAAIRSSSHVHFEQLAIEAQELGSVERGEKAREEERVAARLVEDDARKRGARFRGRVERVGDELAERLLRERAQRQRLRRRARPT